MTARQERYNKLKKAGLCVRCGKPSRPGMIACAECSKYQRETRLFYLKIGFCPVCHRYPVYGTEKECPECRARRIASNRLSYEKAVDEGKGWADPKRAAERAVSRNKRLEAAGRCTACGKLKPMPGKKMCGVCLEKRALRQREYRRRVKEAAG